jgi:hypothetical protein
LLRAPRTGGKPGVSDLFLGPVNGSLILTIAVPVKRDGRVVYSLNATLAPAQLSDVLKEQKLPDTWRASIVDSTASVVARTHDIESTSARKAIRTCCDA